MADARSPHYGLQIPDEGNLTSEEFVRIRNMVLALESVVFGLDTALAGKAATGHDHVIAGVQGLQDELTALSDAISALQSPTLATLNDVNVDSAADGQVLLRLGASWQAAKISSANVTFGATGTVEGQLNSLSVSLSGKAATVHTHTISHVTGLQSALDGKASNAAVNAKLDASASAVNADKVDNLHASSFVRSDADDTVTGHTEWQDGKEIRLGASADFRMMHNGNHTYFTNYTNDLYIRNLAHGREIFIGGEKSNGVYRNIIIVQDGLYARFFYDNSEKLRTDGSGVTVYGRLHADDMIYVGKNGGGDSWIQYYDDNSNTWRFLGWDDSANAFVAEENDGGTHKLALVYDGSSTSNTNYPIGTIIFATAAAITNRNASRGVYTVAGYSHGWIDSTFSSGSRGSQLTGTWRNFGIISAGGGMFAIYVRTA